MRLEEIRGTGVPGLGDVEVRPGEGLVGWTGGDARHRRGFADFLRWALGLPGARPDARGSEKEVPTEPGADLRVRVGGRVLLLRDRGIVLDAEGRAGEALAAEIGAEEDALALVWAGSRIRDPRGLVDAGARVLAGLHGLGRLEAAVARLGGGRAGGVGGSGEGAAELEPEERSRLRGELADLRDRLRALDDVPERLRSLEAELRSLRADAAEVAGDVEAATMEWLRERQDAETHLHAYRDRARELRARIRELEEAGPQGPCPFCERRLEDHFEEVMAGLRDEWEKLVQDGRWWRRRWEQLEHKPAHLREMEGRSVRLQAAVEECAERLERCRFDLRERDELRERRSELLEALGFPEGEAPPEEEESDARRARARRDALGALEAAREDLLDDARARIVRRAGGYLNRISGGRILGLVPGEDRSVVAVEDGRRLVSPTEEDQAAILVALRLAVSAGAVDEGLPLSSILVEEPFDRMDLQARLRAIELLRALRERIPQILLVVSGEAVDAAPERFDGILEVRVERTGRGSVLRRLPGGVGRLRLGGGRPAS